MIKICEICNDKFDTNSTTRIYCYKSSGESTRVDNETRKHQNKLGSGNTISWKAYKQEALKSILLCSNCHKEIHSELGYKLIKL